MLSKALLIAAGIFFAMLILTMIMYMSGKITEIGEVQESKRAAEQLAAFNAEYEAYQKSGMYGVDVISCLNKAKSNGTPEKGINYILDAIKSVREDESKIVKQIRDNIYKRYTIKDINEYASLREEYLKKKEEKEKRRRLIIEKNNQMFSDAYIIFDGVYKIIYNDGKGVLTRRLDRQLLDKDDNNKMGEDNSV